MESKRIEWIDYAKAIAIFCVVLLHANVPYPAKGLIRVWVIPLFFFLSGIFANTQRYTTYRDFFVKKGLHILIPYIGFNILTYLFWLIIGRNYGYDAATHIAWYKPLWGIIYGEYSHIIHYIPIWFLACLFTTESLFYLIFRHIQDSKIYWLTVLAIMVVGGLNYIYNPVALPWGINISLPMMVFYAVGNYFSNKIKNNQYRLLQAKYTPLWFIASLLTVVIVYCLNPGEVLVFKNEYGNYLLFFIGAFAGIIMLNTLCRVMEYFSKYNTWLSFIGRNTLVVLCLHLDVFTLIKGITYFIFNLPLDIYSNTYVIVLTSVVNIIILIPVILLINKYCPILVGKIKTHE